MYNAGKLFIESPSENCALFRHTFREYFVNTKQYLYAIDTNLAGTAYSHFFNEKKVFESLNKYFDSIQNATEIAQRVGMAIKKTIFIVHPQCQDIHDALIRDLVEEILFRVAPSLSVDEVFKYVLGT
jgi:predicted RNase H-related nuclease YkuK (DUF458 family)